MVAGSNIAGFFYFCTDFFCSFFTTNRNPNIATTPRANDNGAFFTNPAKIYVMNDIAAHESA